MLPVVIGLIIHLVVILPIAYEIQAIAFYERFQKELNLEFPYQILERLCYLI